MIRVHELTKRFGPTVAVDRISFSVAAGEVVGFLGPNGAGKTTTLRVLTCYHGATSGRAEVAGCDVARDPLGVRRRIGYLPENVPLYPDLRVDEYLRYRAELKGVPRRQRRSSVERAIERCDVGEVRRKLIGHLSRGYRQRVGLADALVATPPILILDEPTSGLDPNQRRRIKTLVRDLAQQHTILFSSHILSEVQDVSSRILVIDRGRIRADGRPQELLAGAPGKRLVVTAAGVDLAGCLAGIPGVGVLQQAGRQERYVTVTAPVAADADPRDEAARRLQSAGATIRELRLDLPSLEDFFHRLTAIDDDTARGTA
jgi:ABC-2 type transport system ATP-binding protein